MLSLNSSALYLGIASGAVIGGLVLQYGTASDLGWVGALFPLLSLAGMGLSALLRTPEPTLARMG